MALDRRFSAYCADIPLLGVGFGFIRKVVNSAMSGDSSKTTQQRLQKAVVH
jgi:hypothetical protein